MNQGIVKDISITKSIYQPNALSSGEFVKSTQKSILNTHNAIKQHSRKNQQTILFLSRL
jgi:hypothetical protein